MSDSRRGWELVAAQFALLAILVLGPTDDAWTVAGPVRRVGAGLWAVGLITIVVGALRLGRAARIHPAPGRWAMLRTDGPYRLVRHPIYSGVLALAAGITLTAASFVALAAFAALVVVLNAKARFEERLLTERFPDYPAYARRTSRFIPVRRRS